jgi:hypothetical protein
MIAFSSPIAGFASVVERSRIMLPSRRSTEKGVGSGRLLACRRFDITFYEERVGDMYWREGYTWALPNVPITGERPQS